jgi:CRISPR-associated protein Csd1
MNLLAQAVRRNQASNDVTHPRAALIKLVLLSQTDPKEDTMVQLDPNNPSPAYHCGRALAVLENVQRLAIPGVGASVVDRFYGAASSAPATVFGPLLKNTRAHLDKLQRDRPGAYQALERRLEEILGQISGSHGFPKTLKLEDQGLFALGYYHQRAYDRAQALEARDRQQAPESPS